MTRFLLLVSTTLLAASSLGAQRAATPDTLRVLAGAVLRARAATPLGARTPWVDGVLLRAGPDSLVLRRQPGGAEFAIVRPAIRQLEVRAGTRVSASRVAAGGLFGLAGGIALGTALGRRSRCDLDAPCLGAVTGSIGGAVIGLPLGVALGASWRTPRWVPVRAFIAP